MPDYNEQRRQHLQGILDTAKVNEHKSLLPSEYPGPLTISKPVTLDGRGSVIWAKTGQALKISADNVVIKNLRIEVTGAETKSHKYEQCSILCNCADTSLPKFENVEVRGNICGISGEEGDWAYPYSLHLVQLKSGVGHCFIIQVIVPVACDVSTDILRFTIVPILTTPGNNSIRVYIAPEVGCASLIGNLFLTTKRGIRRRIAVNVHFIENGGIVIDHTTIWKPEENKPVIKTMPEKTQETPVTESTINSTKQAKPQTITITTGDCGIPIYPKGNNHGSIRTKLSSLKSVQGDVVSPLFMQNEANKNCFRTDVSEKNEFNNAEEIDKNEPYKTIISSIFTNK